MTSYNQMLVSPELGGAGVVALQLAAALRDMQQRSCVWIPGIGPVVMKAREMGLNYQLYEPVAFNTSKLQDMWRNWRIGKLLKRYYPGLVHVHSPFFYGVIYPALKSSKMQSIVHLHLEEEEEGLRWAFKNPPNIIVTCATFLENYVRRLLPPQQQDSQKIVAIPNAVNTKIFCPGDKSAAKKRFGITDQMPIVLMVANLAPHKGQETALRAAAALKDERINAEFWFAGTERNEGGGYLAQLNALSSHLRVADRVKFLGQRHDISELLLASDVFLLPSTAEGLPLSILEAQASKVPVIAAPTAGIPEIIAHGRTGFLVGANDVTGYAAHLKVLFANPCLYSEIAETAYLKILKEHTLEKYINRMWNLYERLVSSTL